MSAEPETLLWQAVVLRAFEDATAVKVSSKGSNGGVPTELERQQARAWILGRGPDFRKVCALAGMDPDFLADNFQNGRINPGSLAKWRAA